MKIRRKSMALTIIALMVGAVLILGLAQLGRGAGAGKSAAQGQKHDNFVLLIDQSNEMNLPYGSKALKKSVIARQLANSFVKGVPDKIPVKGGIYMYGILAKNPSNTVIRVLKVQGFNREQFEDTIKNRIKDQTGPSSLSWALKMVKDDLGQVPGRTAVIILSGGNKSDPGKPSQEAAALKKAYGPRVCIYTIYIGKNKDEARFLKGLVDDGRCGIALNADSVDDDAVMRKFARSVFFNTL